jgi:hypothetical protein
MYHDLEGSMVLNFQVEHTSKTKMSVWFYGVGRWLAKTPPAKGGG